MIQVNFHGRLGNNLFQYAMGRILAEKMKYTLHSPAIPHLPNTSDTVGGSVLMNMHRLTGQAIDLNYVYSNKGKIGFLLDGFFQRYEYYEPHRDKLLKWFNSKPEVLDPDIVVMHVRRTQTNGSDTFTEHTISDGRITVGGSGDITYNEVVKRHLSRLPQSGRTFQSGCDQLPFEWYQEILGDLSFKNLVICTDVPEDPFFDYFSGYRPIIRRHSTPFEDFNYMRCASTLITSISTLSWWAGFLSEGKVYIPEPDYGCWGHQNDPNETCLSIHDNDRYIVKPATRKGTFF